LSGMAARCVDMMESSPDLNGSYIRPSSASLFPKFSEKEPADGFEQGEGERRCLVKE
jgi:hypothetical protein